MIFKFHACDCVCVWNFFVHFVFEKCTFCYCDYTYISTPLQVKVRNYKNTGETGLLDSYVIDKTTRTITDAERNFILSFLNENGYLINSYQYINFIPFNTNKVWTFSSNNALNEIKVAFNLDEIIDPKTNITGIEELGAVNQLPFDTLFYKANSNFIPFGLEIQF